MILPADIRHKEQIAKLWNTAFGDSVEDIEKYLKTLLKYFLVYEDAGRVKGMLSVLPIKCGNKNGGYIYAVTTDAEFRGHGICRALMDRVKECGKYEFLLLVPQKEGLFDFYEKMDFVKIPLLLKKELLVDKNASSKLTLKKITIKQYEEARNGFFGEGNIVKWDEEMLSLAQNMYNGEFYEIEEGKEKGFAFLYKEKETLVIKELIAEDNDKVASFLGLTLGTKKVKFSYPAENGENTYMAFPKGFKAPYFGIYFD